MRLLIVSAAGLMLAGCSSASNKCICTPIGQIETTVEKDSGEFSCSAYAEDHSEEFSSCIEASGSVGNLGPAVALRVEAAPVWASRWPHVRGSLPPLEPVWLAVR
ncbi:MAG: hypothetical protein AB7L66_16285 [Gemmatimonadales bacterium]